MQSLFHLAIHVRDLDSARHFYGATMGCAEGRSSATWVDFDFFGHQLSLHLGEPFATTRSGHVGDTLVPMPHFGLVLPLPQWQTLAERLQAWQHDGRDVALLIGGPDGLDPALREDADERVRLSDLTLPHAMVRVLLIEQLYRAWSINAGHPYHRE